MKGRCALAANHRYLNRRTKSTTARLGEKCLSCGKTGLEVLSLASLDRQSGCQGVNGRRHHFPQSVNPQ